MKLLEDLIQAHAKTTPGKWEEAESFHGAINCGNKHVAMANYYNSGDPETCVNAEECQANTDFIALAHNALPEIANYMRRMEEALKNIAKQRLPLEMCEQEYDDSDFEGGYIGCVMDARNALKDGHK